MTDKEHIMDKLYGTLAGLFLVYGISTEKGGGEIIIDLLNEAEKQFRFKEQECEELEKQLETSEEWRIKSESLNEKLELRNTRYRKALEEIEKISVKNNITEFDFGGCTDLLKIIVNLAKDYGDILDIINKAKEEE